MELSLFENSMLLQGLRPEELEDLLKRLAARQARYEKGEVLLRAGERTQVMGIVLSGSVTVESNDIWGNRGILSYVGPGEFFAETYALLPEEPMLVDVVANERCTVLFLKLSELRSASFQNRPYALRFLSNLLQVSAYKNLHLSGRSFHTAPKSIRGRVLSYLNSMALQTGSNAFDIPFDRQQFADYLNVERTALSKELSRMRAEGLLDCRKRHFRLLAGSDG